MPYIKPEERIQLRSLTDALAAVGISTAGKLNYFVSMACRSYLGERPNYDAFNAAVGALECAKLELYRRLVAPYEDVKISENGDLP